VTEKRVVKVTKRKTRKAVAAGFANGSMVVLDSDPVQADSAIVIDAEQRRWLLRRTSSRSAEGFQLVERLRIGSPPKAWWTHG
jgi:hypothetical protein